MDSIFVRIYLTTFSYSISDCSMNGEAVICHENVTDLVCLKSDNR